MAVDFKVVGKDLHIEVNQEGGVDQDKDGVKSVEVVASIKAKLDGMEVVDELLKSSELLQKIKEKLGL